MAANNGAGKAHYAWAFDADKLCAGIQHAVVVEGRADAGRLRLLAEEAARGEGSVITEYLHALRFDPSSREDWTTWFEDEEEDVRHEHEWFLLAMAPYLAPLPGLSGSNWWVLEQTVGDPEFESAAREITRGKSLDWLASRLGELRDLRSIFTPAGHGGGLSQGDVSRLIRRLGSDLPSPPPTRSADWWKAIHEARVMLNFAADRGMAIRVVLDP